MDKTFYSNGNNTNYVKLENEKEVEKHCQKKIDEKEGYFKKGTLAILVVFIIFIIIILVVGAVLAASYVSKNKNLNTNKQKQVNLKDKKEETLKVKNSQVETPENKTVYIPVKKSK